MQRFFLAWTVSLVLAGLGSPTPTHGVPWDVFVDPASDSVCDLVNAGNAELVVWSDTGELVWVTDLDIVLEGTFVDGDGVVFVGGFPLGIIDFAEDRDGFRTLWWTGPDGTVIDLDELTLEPVATLVFPDYFRDVPCDACEFWDDPADCVADEDLDGVPDEFDLCLATPPDELVDVDGCACFEVDYDLDDIDECDDECPDTPIDELADVFGCSCSQLDDDLDGVDDCFDQCPATDPRDDVDSDGCPIVVIVPPPVIIGVCGGLTTLTIVATLAGLMTMRLTRRRGA